MLNAGVVPLVPEQGSVGRQRRPRAAQPHRAGAHGRGRGPRRAERLPAPARRPSMRPGLTPFAFAPKEGLAFINGTQAQTALLALLVHDAAVLWRTAVGAAAMSLEALRGTPAPLDPRIHAARPHRGPVRGRRPSCARCWPTARSGNPTARTTRGSRTPTACAARRRCSGAVADAIRFAEETVAVELNASTDNPLVFDGGDVISGRQLPRPAGGPGAGRARHDADHAAGDRRAAGGAAGESGPLPGAAGVPDRRSRALSRVHDGPDHGGLAGGRVAGHRDAGEHRLHPDRRQPGGLRSHGHGRGLEGRSGSSPTPSGWWRPSCCAPPRGSSSSSR